MNRAEFEKEMEKYLNIEEKTPTHIKIINYVIGSIVWIILLLFPILGIIGIIKDNILLKQLGLTSFLLWSIIIYRIIKK